MKEFHRMKSFIRKCIDSSYDAENDIAQDEELANIVKEKSGDDTLTKRVEIQKGILKKVQKWMDDVALFLFGFVMYKICQEIKELHEKEGERPEDEIWVTSIGNLDVNRITRRE